MPVEPVEWRGIALGSLAEIRIHHADRQKAKRLVELALAEVRRLEGLFSLYNGQSALLTLNRTGVLESPAPEFVEILTLARRYHQLSGGLFDPTIQPLWALYEKHFERADASPNGPGRPELEAVLAGVGMDKVIFDRDRVIFKRRGMGLTFNGIAQGFITDKVVELLHRHGIEQTLVDLGEIRAIGARPDGMPWQVAIADPIGQETTKTALPLKDAAIATSGGYGFRFKGDDRFNHIFDPRNGRSTLRHASVSIIQPAATAADAMATAACLMTEEEISLMLSRAGRGEAWIVDHSGETKLIRSS